MSRAIGGKEGDIRKQGSGNPGTTNMLRVYGKKAAAVTLLIDVLKGVAAVLIGTVLAVLLWRSAGTIAQTRSTPRHEKALCPL